MCLPITNDISRNVRSGEVRRTFNIVEKKGENLQELILGAKKNIWDRGNRGFFYFRLLVPLYMNFVPYVNPHYHLYIYSRSPITGNVYYACVDLVPM